MNDARDGDDPGFSDWQPLDEAHVLACPDVPGAVQLGRADRSLITYPKGKSAMVFAFYAVRSMREALRRLFRDEIEEPGARGEGPLVFRFAAGGPSVQARAERLFLQFIEDFGRAPILHPDDDDE